MLVVFVCYCVLLDCESLIHVDFIPLLFMCGTNVFSFSGIKKYLSIIVLI